jgi:hypothetical protein
VEGRARGEARLLVARIGDTLALDVGERREPVRRRARLVDDVLDLCAAHGQRVGDE